MTAPLDDEASEPYGYRVNSNNPNAREQVLADAEAAWDARNKARGYGRSSMPHWPEPVGVGK